MTDIRDYNLNRWGFVDDSGTLITIASSNVSIDELNSILGTINIVPNDNNYVLMVNGREAGVISITSQLKLKNVVYNPDTQSIEFTFDSDEGEKKVSVDVHDLVDVYTAGQGLGVDKNQFFIKIDPSSEKYLSVSENGIKISGLDTLLKNLNETLANFGQETAKAFDQINNVLETSINTINGGIDNEIRPAITKNEESITALQEKVDDIVVPTKVSELENDAQYQNADEVDAKISAHIQEAEDKFATKDELTEETNARTVKDTQLQNDLQLEAEAARTAEKANADAISAINEVLSTKVEYTDVATSENPGRKAIVLKNHDTILGNTKNGTSVNIAMVSKWDKVDLGSAQVSINLNGKDKRPTYNDEKEIALLEDVQGLGATIVLEKTNNLQYTLKVGDAIVGTIDIPKDQFVKSVSYNEESKTIDFVFETTDGEQTVTVNVSNLVDTYTAGNGISLTSNEFSLKIDATTQQYIEVSAEGLKIVNIDERLAEKVGLVDIATKENPNRKAIVLKNHDTILGTTTEGATQNLIMMSKWNKVDVGTASNELNLNGSAEHPTYNDEKKLAFVDEIPSVEGLASEEWVNAQGFLKEHQDISNLATKDEVALKANQSDVDFQVNALNEKIDAIKIPTKVTESEGKILEWNTDVATTRKQVPSSERKAGLIISYKENNSNWINEQYTYNSFTDLNWGADNYWKKIPFTEDILQNISKKYNARIIEWNTDVATTRKQVPSSERKAGLIISYKENNSNWINEQYTYNSFTDLNWGADNYWKKIPFTEDILQNILEKYNVRIIEWNTDVQTTRKQIPFSERKENLILSYKNGNNQIVLEQYKNNVFTDANWQYNANWITYIGKEEILSIVNNAVEGKATKRIGKNLFTNENITNGYINSNGRISGVTSEYRITDYIKIDSNLIANHSQGAGTNNAVYDANKNFLRTFNIQNYTYQEGDSFVKYTFSSKWTNYMIEKGDTTTDYEPYTEDAPLLELILQNKKLIQDSNKELINIPIDKVYIQVTATEGAIERDFGVDMPKTASANALAVVYVRMKKGLELQGNYTLSCYYITNQTSDQFLAYNQTIEQLGKGLVKISRNFSELSTYGYDIIAAVRKNSETDTYLRLAKVVLETDDIEVIQKLKQLDIPKETRTIFNVSKDFDETTIDFGVFNYNNIIDAHKNVINSAETNQYVIRCMPGIYDEFEEEWAGSDEEPDEGSYLGILVQDYEYFESFDKECPELTTLKWDGSAGFSTSMTHLQAARRCIFHINMKNKHTKIEGFSFDCKNVRYCIHPETAGQGWGNKWHIKNCILKFSGRPFVQPADPSWTYIGIGLSNGEHGIIERCKFIENDGKSAIFAHNNPFATSVFKKEVSFKVGARLDIIQCDFGNKIIDISTTTSNVADTYDVCEIVGCKNNAGVSVKPYSDGSQNWKVSLINSDGDILQSL